MIKIEDFRAIELKVAKIISAEKIENSEKLLKLQIDLGEEKRQIVAGIAKFYQPNNLAGREIIVAANLETKIIFGLESQGMLLAANIKGEPVLLKPDKEVPLGVKIT